jgi:ferredoxin
MTAMVDKDGCVRCGICVDICPEHAISMDGRVVVDPTRCTGCGACIAECPNEALSLSPETPAPARGIPG